MFRSKSYLVFKAPFPNHWSLITSHVAVGPIQNSLNNHPMSCKLTARLCTRNKKKLRVIGGSCIDGEELNYYMNELRESYKETL